MLLPKSLWRKTQVCSLLPCPRPRHALVLSGRPVESTYEEVFGFSVEVRSGSTLGVAVTAWVFGTAQAIGTLVLLRRATTDQDGPFRKYMGVCCPPAGDSNAAAPAGAPTVGTV